VKTVYHLEANGKTNTGEYVNKVLEASKLHFTHDIEIKVFTSNQSFYSSQSVLPLFREYGTASNNFLKLYYYFTGFLKIFLHLRKEVNSSVLHLHWLKFSVFDFFILSFIRSFTNTRLIFTVHNVLPHEHNFIDRYFYPLIYKKIDAFTFHSKSSHNRLKQELNVQVENFELIPHYGYEVGDVPVQTNENSLLFFGTIRDYKGLDVLLDACNKLPKKLKWNLNIYGKPEINLDELKAYVARNNLSDRIQWNTGWIEEEKMDEIFLSHDIVVLPYKEIDNSGLLHLAMSYGKPVIASRLGSLMDLIKDEENGILFEANNSDDLTRCISKLLKDEDLKIRLGNNARKLMETDHSIDRVGELHYQLYKKVL